MDNEPETPLEEVGRLRDEPVAPAMLEPRVVAALRQDGLIRSRSIWSRPMRMAASVLIFVAGALVGRYVSPEFFFAPRPAQAPARYLLLLAGDVAPSVDGSSRAAEYGEWARSLAARGIAVSGEELTTHAEIVTQKASLTFPDLSAVGGYFVIEARDDASAAALARTCPHVKYGGSVVVRRIQ